jgi:hypothetical protein
MLEGKRFQNNDNGEIVEVIADTGIFYNLSNGSNIKRDIFFQKYSEMVDPTSFFQKQTQAGLYSLAEQFKTLDTRNAVDGDIPPTVRHISEQSNLSSSTPEQDKQDMIRRYNETQARKDLSQYKVYENEDDAVADFERRQKDIQQNQMKQNRKSLRQQRIEEEEKFLRGETPQVTEHVESYSETSQLSYLSKDEEAYRFFKSFKRIYPVKLTIDFDEKIAEPGFLKLMVTNMEADIIQYYTKEIMNRIHNDPGYLENKIYERLRTIVFEEKVKPKRMPRVKVVVKEEIPSKMTRKLPKKRTVKVKDREKFQDSVDNN